MQRPRVWTDHLYALRVVPLHGVPLLNHFTAALCRPPGTELILYRFQDETIYD